MLCEDRRVLECSPAIKLYKSNFIFLAISPHNFLYTKTIIAKKKNVIVFSFLWE